MTNWEAENATARAPERGPGPVPGERRRPLPPRGGAVARPLGGRASSLCAPRRPMRRPCGRRNRRRLRSPPRASPGLAPSPSWHRRRRTDLAGRRARVGRHGPVGPEVARSRRTAPHASGLARRGEGDVDPRGGGIRQLPGGAGLSGGGGIRTWTRGPRGAVGPVGGCGSPRFCFTATTTRSSAVLATNSRRRS